MIIVEIMISTIISIILSASSTYRFVILAITVIINVICHRQIILQNKMAKNASY